MRIRIMMFVFCAAFAATGQQATSTATAAGSNRDEAAELLRQHRDAMAESPIKVTAPPASPDDVIATSIADSGTNGDVIMSSPAPFTTTDVLL